MTGRERAKQFMPFDALKGLKEALREREEMRTRVEKRELSEESADELSYRLSRIRVGDEITLTFYERGHYLTVTATVTAIDTVDRRLTLGGTNILFEDIFRIEEK